MTLSVLNSVWRCSLIAIKSDDQCRQIYLSLRSSDESVPLEQLNEGNLSLQQSQPHTNTAAWSKTKGHVGHLRPIGFFFCSKPVGRDEYLMHSCIASIWWLTVQDQIFLDPSNRVDCNGIHQLVL